MFKIVTINGSARENNYTGKALALVNNELINLGVELISFETKDLNLAVPGYPPTEDGNRIKEQVESATGVILATPEYHGSYSSIIKQVIENLGFPSVLTDKPVALMGVAAGQIGAIKSLEHLRSVCSHVGAIVLPGPVSLANVQSIFDEQGHCTDPKIEKRIRGTAKSLVDYINNNICPKLALEQMVRNQS